jgi:tetratricopeptide (TPR) repeat protein
VNLFNEAKYDESLAKLSEAEVVDAAQVATNNLRGAVYVKQRKYAQAAEAFKAILASQPDNSIAWFNYGESQFLAKNYSQAKESFKRYLETEGNKTNALARFKIILCDILSGNVSEARKAVENLRPTISHPLEYYGRAAIEFNAGRDAEAREYLKSAFDIYPGGMNLAFADSFKELGWLKPDEVAQIGAVNAAALQSLSTEFQPSSNEGSDAYKEKFESMLPSLGGGDDDSQ